MKFFVSSWNERYKMVNVIGQLVGLIVAIAVSLANYKIAITSLKNGFHLWGITQSKINSAGWIYLYWQIPLFYWITSVYVIQGLTMIVLLFRLTHKFEIKVSSFHYDNCCGLKAICQLGLRNQYLLWVVGMNLLALLVVNIRRGIPITISLLIAGVIAYVSFGPIVFVCLLLPFRKAMLSEKEKQQAKVSGKLQQEYNRIMSALEKNSIMTKEDEDIIDRLEKFKAIVNRIPVWPFDISTLRRFFNAYILPFLTSLVYLLINYLLKTFGATSGGGS